VERRQEQFLELCCLLHMFTILCCRSTQFADDFAGMASGSDAAAVEVILQDTLDKLQIWTKKLDMDLNISKTKVMLFADNNPGQVTIGIDGATIEQVDEFKYLGVMLDTRLRFEAHAEYACTKARKACAKVNRLIHGRKGLSVQLGVQLYKCLVRSHLEFAVPAWANLPDSSLKKLERVQGQCLRSIIGARAHTCLEAMEVITNMMPIRFRAQELCVSQFMHIKRKPDDSNLQTALRTAEIVHGKMTPMLKYVSREFQRSLGNLEIERDTGCQVANMMDGVAVGLIDLCEGTGGAGNRSHKQKTIGQRRVTEFVKEHGDQAVMVFLTVRFRMISFALAVVRQC